MNDVESVVSAKQTTSFSGIFGNPDPNIRWVMRDLWMTPPALGFLAFAQSSRINWEPRILTNSLWIVGFLLVGALVIAAVAHWRKNIRDQRISPSQQLAHFRKLREEGKISPEEFEALRLVLGGRIRKSLDNTPKLNADSSEPTTDGDNSTSNGSSKQNPERPESNENQASA